MNIAQAKKAIEYAFKINRTLNLIGLHGIGKSSIVYQAAAELGYEVIEIRLGQMADAGDLIGLQEFIRDPDTQHAFATRHVLPEWFPQNKKKVILFLDELNRAPKDIQQGIFELVYDKRLKGVSIGEDCHVVSACNPATSDYQVMDFNDSAFQDRFIHVMLQPTVKEFLTYGRDTGAAACVVDFIENYPKMLENSDLESSDLSFVKPSRRSWFAVSDLRKAMPEDEKDLFLEMVMGIVGREAAIAYKSFAETYVSAITAQDILADYSKVKSKHLQLMEKGRLDILANVLDDFQKEFSERGNQEKGMTLAEAKNLIAFMKELNPEQKFALAVIIRDNPACCRHVEGMPKGGLFESDEIEEMLIKTKKLRDEARAKANERKNKESSEIPF
jgi:hypothetical protein